METSDWRRRRRKPPPPGALRDRPCAKRGVDASVDARANVTVNLDQNTDPAFGKLALKPRPAWGAKARPKAWAEADTEDDSDPTAGFWDTEDARDQVQDQTRVRESFSNPFLNKSYSRDFVWPTLPREDPRHSYDADARPAWRSAKVAARHLKFCPGEQCNVWLPLHCFASNCNMDDGLDIYCIDCNARRRDEKNRKRRAPFQQLAIDKYELFRSRHATTAPREEIEEEARMREIKKRIGDAHKDATKRFGVFVRVDPIEVCRQLFMGKRFSCMLTGERLTPECFLDHHSITFELEAEQGVLEIICSDCISFHGRDPSQATIASEETRGVRD